jgi:hypothetical protein
MEFARVDCSMATFHGVHSGLAYEGTREINTLVVGRAITGFGAFV